MLTAMAGRRSGGDVWVATTRLALALAAGGGSQAKRDGNEGFIVVETNYRVSTMARGSPQQWHCMCIIRNRAGYHPWPEGCAGTAHFWCVQRLPVWTGRPAWVQSGCYGIIALWPAAWRLVRTQRSSVLLSFMKETLPGGPHSIL